MEDLRSSVEPLSFLEHSLENTHLTQNPNWKYFFNFEKFVPLEKLGEQPKSTTTSDLIKQLHLMDTSCHAAHVEFQFKLVQIILLPVHQIYRKTSNPSKGALESQMWTEP